MAEYIALKKCTIRGTEYAQGDTVILHPHLARGLMGKWLARAECKSGSQPAIKDMLKADIVAELAAFAVEFSAKDKRGVLADLLATARKSARGVGE